MSARVRVGAASRDAEVAELDVARGGEEDVLRLEVAMQHAVRVHVLE